MKSIGKNKSFSFCAQTKDGKDATQIHFFDLFLFFPPSSNQKEEISILDIACFFFSGGGKGRGWQGSSLRSKSVRFGSRFRNVRSESVWRCSYILVGRRAFHQCNRSLSEVAYEREEGMFFFLQIRNRNAHRIESQVSSLS